MGWAICAAGAAALLLLMGLDASGAINWNRTWAAALLLPLGPHVVLWGWLLWTRAASRGAGVFSLVLLALAEGYLLLRHHFFSVRLREPRATFRLRQLMAGRWMALAGEYAGWMQVPVMWVLWSHRAEWTIPTGMLAADSIVAAALIFLLYAGGMVRLLCTSYRLSVVRRFLVALLSLIPVANLIAVGYACRLAGQEYDHALWKADQRAARADSEVCRTRYPLLMMHGVGFRDFKYLNYWGRIPRELERNGAAVYYGKQEAWGTIESNAADIRRRIREVVEETGCGKVNLVAHSKGGLDARYVVSGLGMAPYVASVTTISTPHRGCPMVDWALRMPDGLYRWIGRMVDRYFRWIGDETPDFCAAARQFSTPYAAKFNEDVPNAEGVYYQSYMSVMGGMFSDSLLCFPYLLVKLTAKKENDGLVDVQSAQWGEFRGVFRNRCRRGISHGDIIDLKREDYRGFDVREAYVGIVADLKQKGF